jgi:hypothetical protein
MTSLRDKILAANDLVTETVRVDEWDVDLTIRTLTGKERDKFEASMVKITKSGKPEQDIQNIRARLVQLCVIDPDDGNLPVFTEKDIPDLGGKSALALDKVFAAAQKLNGFTKEDVEALAEGFDSDPSESSTSE